MLALHISCPRIGERPGPNRNAVESVSGHAEPQFDLAAACGAVLGVRAGSVIGNVVFVCKIGSDLDE